VANSSAGARRRSASLVFLPTTRTEPGATQDAAGSMGRLWIGQLARVGARPVGVLAVASAVVLLASHSLPWPLGAAAYRVASALPLVLVALAVLGAQVARRTEPVELAKAVLLAVRVPAFVTTQLGAVATTATIRERMGHGSLEVTGGYVHRVSEADQQAAQHMAELFDSQSEP
jgi:hypothetical protein